jgi:hypothetical protein
LSNRHLVARLSRGLLALAVPIAAAFGSGASADVASEWMPLRPGQRSAYEVHRDHSYIPAQGSIDRVFHKGGAVQTMRSADGVAPGAVTVEERTQLEPVQAGTPESVLEVRVLSAVDGISLLASGTIANEGDAAPTRYQPPLRLLPTTRPGESWNVGTVRDRETSIELRGRVVGVGELTDDPGCESCLEVRYDGPIAGRIPVYGGEAEILSGRIERRVWHRRGVGIVREVVTIETELKLPDAKRARVASFTTLRLVEQTLAP